MRVNQFSFHFLLMVIFPLAAWRFIQPARVSVTRSASRLAAADDASDALMPASKSASLAADAAAAADGADTDARAAAGIIRQHTVSWGPGPKNALKM